MGKKILIGGGVLVLLIIVATAIGSGGKSNTSTTPSASSGALAAGQAQAAVAAAPAGPEHSEDVTITACAPDEAGYAAAKVTVTNHSSKASNYIINIVFESGDGATQIGTGLVAVNGLQSGQQSPQDTSALKPALPGYRCRVQDITRYAA
ncbi:hypothetical protein [Candidatus Frankia nodulisporulans]|uniref:hypothetical protein n=1 Tax=Candidatus Frankia nodulisporulans TaxID=2060052 RepID=UPI0013D843F9|nr:hypothetical protein [Candidatus Frankia nodulisporulans]